MVFWIILIVILLIVLEEGLYYLSNRFAFDSQPKEQLDDNQVEKKPSRIRSLFQRRKDNI
ncbi:hypothetical protein [Ornithinibacillus scapharcae]|uniref:hypothetical protein n=1 Tax=Ornithinibacillus scapharcae TaxID=1147159 RepID=UPI000225B00C|nr:hypothetical protein [Ornithinibacillus scapharcae]